uniref:Reverse transcriptase/retrotransposon-derived protein RNase H-like domain-containing protein n=1 Tax=Otus sunia TaxID=257818 RepID=A0A8C8APD4_9STRI
SCKTHLCKGYGNMSPDATFKKLKASLMRAPALGLPDPTKAFELFTHQRQGVALGVLTQFLGPEQRAVAYFSKQLDTASQGWPGCLRAVAATMILIIENNHFWMQTRTHILMEAVSYRME